MIFRFFKMAVVSHLVFVVYCLDHPRRAFDGLYHHAKFASFNILRVRLENVYSRPQNVFLWI